MRATTAVKRFSGAGLEDGWSKLHKGDAEPFPTPSLVARLAKSHAEFGAWVEAHGGERDVAQGVQEAWRHFHAGEFAAAIGKGAKQGALGATPANKAAAIHSLNVGGTEALRLLDGAIARGEQAVAALPDYPNAHYMLSLALGRYSQRISIVQALANGIASRVRTHLDATLKLEPKHAEAHIALGLYHAEIVAKIGALLAGITYRASAEAAIEHFERACKLAPKSPIAKIEYANGLRLLDVRSHRAKIEKLYSAAAASLPLDAMEELDVERARRGPF